MHNHQRTFLSYISLSGVLSGSILLGAHPVNAAEVNASTPLAPTTQPLLTATSPEPSDKLALPLQPTEAFVAQARSVDVTTPTSLNQATAPVRSSITSVAQFSNARSLELNPMAQVTSVSQLSDVKPTDWAFQALQSLVERYGCIVGYPDKTFRGNRALSRYEFAAGLNACMDRISELIAAATADLVKKEDLLKMQKLQEEFAAELATLRGRVDALEVRAATLEKQQFSTTTKLTGEVIFSLAGAYGASRATPGAQDAETVFNNRVRLNLNTSFTGKDLLITGLQAYNFGQGPSALLGGSGSLGGTLGYGDPVFGNASQIYLGYAPQFPETNPQTLAGGRGGNRVDVYKLLYIFPVASKVTAFVGTNAETSDAFPSILPWASEGQGALSRFATLPAAHRVSGGTSQTGLAAAAGLIFSLSETIDFRALFASVNASLPGNQGFPGTPLGAGIFNGSYAAAAQLTVKPAKAISVALNYSHSYHQINILGTGLSASDIGSVLFNPTPLEIAARGGGLGALGAIANQGIKMDTLGITGAWQLTPQLAVAGSFSYIFSSLVDIDASTNFLSWQVGLQAKDLFMKGSAAGVIFGQPLSRVSTSGRAFDSGNRTPYQVEGFFNMKVNDNISITPGIFVIFNAEEQSSSRTVFVPVVRTTFSF